MTAEYPKDNVFRFKSSSMFNEVSELADKLDISEEKLINAAITLYEWSVGEINKGNDIASVKDDEILYKVSTAEFNRLTDNLEDRE